MASEDKTYEFEGFRFDAKNLMLYRAGESIPLAPKAAETLLVFIERRGQILSKEELIEQIWPDAFVEESNLFLYLSVLRKTLGNQENGTPYLETLRRRGYRFNATVELVSDDPADLSIWRQSNPTTNDLTASRRGWTLRRSSLAAIGVIALVALAFGYKYFFSPRSIRSIAVMPFANKTGDPQLDYLSDELAGDLIESLEKVPGLEVKALSTVRYKGRNFDARTIGQELNVEAVLLGSVLESGELQVELVDSRNGNNLWRRKYPKKESGLVVQQSELAGELVRKLSVPIAEKIQEKVAKRDTENSDAKELYLRGVHHARKLTEQDIKKAIDLFWQAIHKDPAYARAYAAIASAHRGLTMCCDGHPSELIKGKDAALKAVALDPELAEGHSALAAFIFSYDWNWAEAEKEYQRALELDPNSSMAHFAYGDFLGFMGKNKEAAAQKDRAAELEPFEPFFVSRVGRGRDPEKALKQILYAISLDPNYSFSHVMAAGVYRERKEYDKAIAEGELAKKLSPDQTWSDVGLSRTFVEAGRLQEARAILDQLLERSKSRFVPPFHIALVYKHVGDKERALEWLEKAYDIRDPKMTFLKSADWKIVENDPRFQDILRRVGLPDAK